MIVQVANRLTCGRRDPAGADLAGSWHDKQLTDDFVAVVMHNLSRLPEKARASLESAMVEAKTSA